MLATTQASDKADIRQIVGRDRIAWRISAIQFGLVSKAEKSPALMSKGLQGFLKKWHGVCDMSE